MLLTDTDIVAGTATRLLLYSAAFQHVEQNARQDRGDPGLAVQIAQMASAEALGVINNLCLTVRNLQDKQPANLEARTVQCGHILKSKDKAECSEAFNTKAVPDARWKSLGIRDALNKFAHFNDSRASYRVEGGIHSVILEGEMPSKKDFWTASINVEQLALACITSVRLLQASE